MANRSVPLEVEIRRRIEGGGPIAVAPYMELCLTHPERGYYTTGDPFGAQGDFITAPEISQMFGELVGAVGGRRVAGDGVARPASTWWSSGRVAAP